MQMLEVHEKDNGELRPSPVSATAPRPASPASKPKVSAAMIIPVWIVLSSAVIIYNNYLYNTLQFRFPVFLVTWHLTFAVSAAVFRSFWQVIWRIVKILPKAVASRWICYCHGARCSVCVLARRGPSEARYLAFEALAGTPRLCAISRALQSPRLLR